MIFDNHGIVIPDVSFYQDDNSTPGKVDFVKMKAAGAMGVIIRAGQNSWEDPDFRDHWKAAREVGLPRGSYWFFDSRSGPGTQANLWRSLIGNDVPELGFWTDLEESYGGVFKGERNWRQLVLAMQAFYPGILHGVYTADWWWQAQVVAEPWFWKAYPLWVAQYVSQPSYVDLPAPWREGTAVLWQHTSSGNGPFYGAESMEIDLNFFNGDENKFKSYFHLTETLPSPDGETGETMARIIKGTVVATAIQRRQAPAGDAFMPARYLQKMDVIEADRQDTLLPQWLHLTKINGVAVVGDDWVSAGMSEQYISWEWVDVPTEPEPPTPAPDTVSVDIEADIVATFNDVQYHGVIAFGNVQLQKVE
jgi:GH25 family lysozyme M1 (1,4-beta-N-acetylmuramidase)